MKQDFSINLAHLIGLTFGILGLTSMIGTRYYKLNSKYLRIKSSKKLLSGQEILNLYGVCFVCAIPFLFMISDPSIAKSFFADILSNPIAIICFLIMILCPIGAVIVSIYVLISNLAKSYKSNFIKEIVLCREDNYIKVYSNLGLTVIPFDKIVRFSVNITTTAVPNVRSGAIRGGITIMNKFGSCVTGGLIGAAANTGNVDVITDIKVVIQTVHGVIKINTLGNIIFDSNSQKLLEAILEYKTKFKKFIFNNN